MTIIGILVAIVFLFLLYKWLFAEPFGSSKQKEEGTTPIQEQRMKVEELKRKLQDRMRARSTRKTAEESAHVEDVGETYAQVLGLGSGRSIDNIKACYRERMKEYHPDKVAQLAPKFRELAEVESKKINAAYDYFKSMLRFS
jgi:DnaJ-domain-containing protein 1